MASQFDIVVIGTSTGGLKALQTLLSGLPAEFSLPIVIVQHRGKDLESGLCEYLGEAASCRLSNLTTKNRCSPVTFISRLATITC